MFKELAFVILLGVLVSIIIVGLMFYNGIFTFEPAPPVNYVKVLNSVNTQDEICLVFESKEQIVGVFSNKEYAGSYANGQSAIRAVADFTGANEKLVILDIGDNMYKLVSLGYFEYSGCE